MKRPALLLALLLSACGSDESAAGSASTPNVTPPPRVLPTTPPPTPPTGVAAGTPLEKIQLGVVGRWQGTASFVGEPTRRWSMWLDLYADGHYSAGCLADDKCIAAFHEGNDGDYPTKQYALYDLGGDASVAIGELYVLFGADGTVTPTAWRGALRDVRLSSDGKQLTFEFRRLWRSDSSPIRYELRRVL